jgi:hypothetical protein
MDVIPAAQLARVLGSCTSLSIHCKEVIQLFHPIEQEVLQDKVSEVPCLNVELRILVYDEEQHRLDYEQWLSQFRCLHCGELLDDCECLPEEYTQEDKLPF